MNLGEAYRIREGDLIQLRSISSNAGELRASLSMVIDSTGEDIDLPTLVQTTASDRTVVATNSAPITQNGWITSLNVEGDLGVKRGQIYCKVQSLSRSTLRPRNYYFAGYVYDEFRAALGFFEESLEGRGFLSWVPAFTGDRAGNAAAIDFDLFATNARRKIYGVVWYYHCSADVATRTLISPTLIGLGGTKPTGFTQTGLNAYFWNTSNVTLTGDEEGTIASYAATSMGRTATVDDGVATIIDTSTLPTPWPLWVTEDDTDTVLRFGAITNGEAADTHSAYVLIEEWIEI